MNRIWNQADILAKYKESVNYEAVTRIRAERLAALGRAHWEKLREIFARLPAGPEERDGGGRCVGVIEGVVTVGCPGDLTSGEQNVIREAVEALMPWRKGPFRLFGVDIDAEWRSDLKWSRLEPQLGSLEEKVVADIGCGNGYYMYRASELAPQAIIGFDPSEQFYFSFELFQRYVRDERLQYELLGVEHLNLFPEFFDVVLCLGVIYHQRSPLEMLQWIKSAMKPGAELFLETQAIPGDEPVALFAPSRYCKLRNVYFVPTASCLESWLTRAGFVDVAVFSEVKLTTEEQRRTRLAPYESLEDFLDPRDLERTVEGFPAPRRVCVKARKR